MTAVTSTSLDNAALDLVSLSDVINGAYNQGGTGVITTRLSQSIKTLAKVLHDLEIEGDAALDEILYSTTYSRSFFDCVDAAAARTLLDTYSTTEIAAAITASHPGAWTDYTPVVTPISGTFTNVAGAGRYKFHGKVCFLTVKVTLTTVGTGVGVRVSLPVAAAASSSSYVLTGLEGGVTNYAASGRIASGASIADINPSHSATPAVNGYVYYLTGIYETA